MVEVAEKYLNNLIYLQAIAVPPIDCKSNPPAYTFLQGWQLLALAVSLFVPKNNR